MAKAKRKAKRRAAATGTTVTLETAEVKELQRGMRKLMGLYGTRKILIRKVRRVDDAIRDQRKYNAQILSAGANTPVDNLGELPVGK